MRDPLLLESSRHPIDLLKIRGFLQKLPSSTDLFQKGKGHHLMASRESSGAFYRFDPFAGDGYETSDSKGKY